jgi:hypothetical protein
MTASGERRCGVKQVGVVYRQQGALTDGHRKVAPKVFASQVSQASLPLGTRLFCWAQDREPHLIRWTGESPEVMMRSDSHCQYRQRMSEWCLKRRDLAHSTRSLRLTAPCIVAHPTSQQGMFHLSRTEESRGSCGRRIVGLAGFGAMFERLGLSL